MDGVQDTISDVVHLEISSVNNNGKDRATLSLSSLHSSMEVALTETVVSCDSRVCAIKNTIDDTMKDDEAPSIYNTHTHLNDNLNTCTSACENQQCDSMFNDFDVDSFLNCSEMEIKKSHNSVSNANHIVTLADCEVAHSNSDLSSLPSVVQSQYDKRNARDRASAIKSNAIIDINISAIARQEQMPADIMGVSSVTDNISTLVTSQMQHLPAASAEPKLVNLKRLEAVAANKVSDNTTCVHISLLDADAAAHDIMSDAASEQQSVPNTGNDIKAVAVAEKLSSIVQCAATAAMDTEVKRDNHTNEPHTFSHDDKTQSQNSDSSQSNNSQNINEQVVYFNVHINYSQRITDEDGNIRWSCTVCGKTFTTKHSLIMHILSHNDIRPHSCLTCGKFFKQLSHLKTHMLTHTNTRQHVCRICRRAFLQISHLKRHLITHKDQQKLNCQYCSRGFAYESELKSHEGKHKQCLQNGCPHCGASFTTVHKLKHHIMTAHSRGPIRCEQCGKVFNYQSQLKDHLKSHSQYRPFSCDDCGKKFLKEQHLRTHALTHSGIKPYSCSQCKRAFSQQANLQRHMLIHTAERQYKCHLCDREFTQLQTLHNHMYTHSKEKPFSCDTCGKEFSRRYILQAHLSLHKEAKPHSCVCGAAFNLKGNLNRHRKQHHGIIGSMTAEEEAAIILKSMSNKKLSSLAKQMTNTENTETEQNVELGAVHSDHSPTGQFTSKDITESNASSLISSDTKRKSTRVRKRKIPTDV